MENRDDSTGLIQVLVIFAIIGGLALISTKSGLILLGGVLLMTAGLGQLAILGSKEGNTFRVERRPEERPKTPDRLMKNAS
jgi:hypothetical protein